MKHIFLLNPISSYCQELVEIKLDFEHIAARGETLRLKYLDILTRYVNIK